MTQTGSSAAAAALFAPRPGEIAQVPSGRQVAADRAFRAICVAVGYGVLLLVAFIVGRIAVSAAPAIGQYGLGFLTGRVWDPNTERYGILGERWGTVYTSALALVIGSAFGLAVAVFLSEGYLATAVFGALKRFGLELHPFWGRLPDRLEHLLKNLIELLAAIPSVVY